MAFSGSDVFDTKINGLLLMNNVHGSIHSYSFKEPFMDNLKDTLEVVELEIEELEERVAPGIIIGL